MPAHTRHPQISILGSADPGSRAFDLAAEAGELLASLGITVVSGCGSPATRVAAERAVAAGGTVLSIIPADQMPPADWPATIVIPCGMGDAPARVKVVVASFMQPAAVYPQLAS
jgi:predicted Rossmann-fold nucleotide-binding protein